MSRQRIEPQRGRAFVMSRGDTLRVIDPSGEQVADFVAFARADAGGGGRRGEIRLHKTIT